MVHATVAEGIYIVGGPTISDELDGLVLLVQGSDACALIGMGAGRSLHALVRNILELGIGISRLRYAVVPIPDPCIAGGCKQLKEMLPHIMIAAPGDIARLLRNGIDYLGRESYDPCPVSLETEQVDLGGVNLRLIKVRENAYAVLCREVMLLRSVEDLIHIISQIRELKVSRICFFYETECISVKQVIASAEGRG